MIPSGAVITIVPVITAHVGCVVLTVADAGGAGCALITTLADATEVHPAALVTVKLYVPVIRPDIVVLKVFPAIDPGLIVQFPAGRPLNTTLPVANAHVGCVIKPTTGAGGAAGCTLMIALPDDTEVHVVIPSVTVKV